MSYNLRGILLPIVAVLSLLTVNAQTMKEVADSIKAASKSGSIKAMASTVKGAFEAKSAKAGDLVGGSWVYVEPAVLSTSKKKLKKMAGNTITNKLEKLIDDYYTRAKLTPENTYFIFNKNGTHSFSLSGRKNAGTWMTAGDQVLLAVNNEQLAAMVSHLENDTLALVTDTSLALKVIQKHGGFSDNKLNTTLVKLAKHVKGVKVGFLLTRRKQ